MIQTHATNVDAVNRIDLFLSTATHCNNTLQHKCGCGKQDRHMRWIRLVGRIKL